MMVKDKSKLPALSPGTNGLPFQGEQDHNKAEDWLLLWKKKLPEPPPAKVQEDVSSGKKNAVLRRVPAADQARQSSRPVSHR
jgi:hypothetical protein